MGTGKPAPPKELGDAGRRLWGSILDTLELNARETHLLTLACEGADTLAALVEVGDREGEMVPGSKGQMRLHPALIEMRQIRLAVDRHLRGIDIPAETTKATPTSQRASVAARAKHGRRRHLEEVRRGVA